jgi:hypothetical protein
MAFPVPKNCKNCIPTQNFFSVKRIYVLITWLNVHYCSKFLLYVSLKGIGLNTTLKKKHKQKKFDVYAIGLGPQKLKTK